MIGLPANVVINIIHFLPLDTVVSLYEDAQQRIPVRVLARLLSDKLKVEIKKDTYFTNTWVEFSRGKYRFTFKEKWSNSIYNTTSYFFTDYITSIYDGDHCFYTNTFRRSKVYESTVPLLGGQSRLTEEKTSEWTSIMERRKSSSSPFQSVRRRSPFANARVE
jgi:hypothetical protein